MDITYLDKNFYSNKTEYKYIIDCIDHFSKFYWGFLIRDKTAETTLHKIKNFIGIFKKPKIIQTDNGKEFKNRLLENYLEETEIKHVSSRPHHPQTNGCLERYHREVHKLMKNYLDKLNSFNDKDVENALDDYIEYHNKTKKTSTKFIPNEIRDTDNQLLIKEILQNIISSFKKHQIILNEKIDKNEKLLMWDKTTIRNNIHFKNMKDKKGNYIYPCKFKEYVNNENIKAIFEININNVYNIDEEIIGNLECFIIVPEFVYNYYSILYEKNENITENMLYKDDDVENE